MESHVVVVFPSCSEGESGPDGSKYQVIPIAGTENGALLLPIFLREYRNGLKVVSPGGQTNCRRVIMDKIGQQVANRLLSRIVDGLYGREGRLPSERELSVQMEASRPSVREALQILEQWSVVSIRPGSGTVVRPVREWQLDVLRAAPSQPELPWNQGTAITDELLQIRRGFYRDVA